MDSKKGETDWNRCRWFALPTTYGNDWMEKKTWSFSTITQLRPVSTHMQDKSSSMKSSQVWILEHENNRNHCWKWHLSLKVVRFQLLQYFFVTMRSRQAGSSLIHITTQKPPSATKNHLRSTETKEELFHMYPRQFLLYASYIQLTPTGFSHSHTLTSESIRTPTSALGPPPIISHIHMIFNTLIFMSLHEHWVLVQQCTN